MMSRRLGVTIRFDTYYKADEQLVRVLARQSPEREEVITFATNRSRL